jgi:hypothetical protein
MKANLCLAGFLLFAGLPFNAPAMAGKLNSPSLAFPKDYPETNRVKIIAALQPADGKFLGGDFLNWTTQLRYGGNTTNLNSFLDRLTKCPEVVISISFSHDFTDVLGDDSAVADWSVSHSASDPNRLHVQINLQSNQIKLEDLSLPDLKSAAEPTNAKSP